MPAGVWRKIRTAPFAYIFGAVFILSFVFSGLYAERTHRYGATEELLSLDDVNIESLTALINKYEVVPEDQNAIMVKIQLIVLDLMGKLDQTWYEIWNDKVKPALNHIHNTRNVASAANAEQS